MSDLQVAILVPTEILADQHYKTFKQIFSHLPVKISCIKSKIKGKMIILLKPNTFMNLSGKAINYWIKKEKELMQQRCFILNQGCSD